MKVLHLYHRLWMHPNLLTQPGLLTQLRMHRFSLQRWSQHEKDKEDSTISLVATGTHRKGKIKLRPNHEIKKKKEKSRTYDYGKKKKITQSGISSC